MNQNNLSTLINEANTDPAIPTKVSQNGTNDPQLPKSVTVSGKAQPIQYGYVYFRFLPDGSTNLPIQGSTTAGASGAWCITLQNITDPAKPATPPANFFTLVVDPVSGTIKQYRPGI
jgi:hypothetical protein